MGRCASCAVGNRSFLEARSLCRNIGTSFPPIDVFVLASRKHLKSWEQARSSPTQKISPEPQLKTYTMTASDIIRLLDLRPHPEGGHSGNASRSDEVRRQVSFHGNLFFTGSRRSFPLAQDRFGRSLALVRRGTACAFGLRRGSRCSLPCTSAWI